MISGNSHQTYQSNPGTKLAPIPQSLNPVGLKTLVISLTNEDSPDYI
jgi:hypothetical protein